MSDTPASSLLTSLSTELARLVAGVAPSLVSIQSAWGPASAGRSFTRIDFAIRSLPSGEKNVTVDHIVTSGTRANLSAAAARKAIILVASMHRCGASALSGVLNLRGVAMPGELLRPDDRNDDPAGQRS